MARPFGSYRDIVCAYLYSDVEAHAMIEIERDLWLGHLGVIVEAHAWLRSSAIYG